jgi:hypothetical protein
MTPDELMTPKIWHGHVFSNGWTTSRGGTGVRFGGTSNVDAFTDTRWITMRGEIPAYPF